MNCKLFRDRDYHMINKMLQSGTKPNAGVDMTGWEKLLTGKQGGCMGILQMVYALSKICPR